MLAKILVGVLAAVAVTGVGVYYAMPDNSHGCCGKKTPAPTETSSDAPAVCSGDAETPSCCSKPAVSACCAAAPTDATNLAAGVGGMALTNTAPTTVKKAAHCCEE